MGAAARLERDGNPELAMDAYVKLGALGDAARVARALGKLSVAAELYAEANDPVPVDRVRPY